MALVFRHRVLNSLTDAQQNFEQITSAFGGGVPLETDGSFYAAGPVVGGRGQAYEVGIGWSGLPGGAAGIYFGTAADTNLYRSTANVLKTDDHFQSAMGVGAYLGDAAQVVMGNQGPSNQAGFTFSSAGDTNLYRSAANTLKTDDAFIFSGAFGVQMGTSSHPVYIDPGSGSSPEASEFQFGDGSGWKLGFAPITGANAGVRFLNIVDFGNIEFLATVAAATVANKSLFVDSADSKLKYKDSGGTTNALY